MLFVAQTFAATLVGLTLLWGKVALAMVGTFAIACYGWHVSRLISEICESSGDHTGEPEYYLWFFGARTESPVYSSQGSAPLNVGIELKLESGSLVVMDVIPGGPADINGLTRGDRIVAVNERTLRGVSTEDVAEMLKGSDGSAVNFVVLDRNGDRREIRIVRRPLSATLLQNYRR